MHSYLRPRIFVHIYFLKYYTAILNYYSGRIRTNFKRTWNLILNVFFFMDSGLVNILSLKNPSDATLASLCISIYSRCVQNVPMLLHQNMCTRMRQERAYRAKSKYDLMRILSELVFIPQTQESIGCCMHSPIFYFLHRAVVFNIQPDMNIRAFGRRDMPKGADKLCKYI